MAPVDISHLVFVVSVFLIFIIALLERYVKKFKLDIRHFCLIFGTYLLFLMHVKCFPYFIFVYFISMTYGLKNVKFPKIDNRVFNYLKQIGSAILNACYLMLFITMFVTMFYMKQYYAFETYSSSSANTDSIADYIIDNYDVEQVKLYTTFDDGGYYEFRGLKAFVDPRAELFFKKYNHKIDIFEEAMEVEKDTYGYDFESFVNKYDFTHLVVFADSNFDNYLKTCDKYEEVYVVYVNNDETNPYQRLYVLSEENK